MIQEKHHGVWGHELRPERITMEKHPIRRSTVGGQAVMEGVMMKSPEGTALAVRQSDGSIVKEFYHTTNKHKPGSFPTWPVVRGVYAFVDSLIGGMKITTRSAELLGEEYEEEPGKFEKWLSKTFHKDIMDVAMGVAIVLAVGLALGLFVLLPSLLVSLLHLQSGFTVSLLEGVCRLVIFIGYLLAVSRIKDIKRVFMYHGAEHKTIACYEAEGEMTPANILHYTRFHARCGTNYLFLVMMVSILFFACIPVKALLPRLITRILFIPGVAGLAYEVLKAAAKSDCLLARIVRAPGLALQRITTAEPTEDMAEVALAAFNLAMNPPAEDLRVVLPKEKEQAAEEQAPAEATETVHPEVPEEKDLSGAPEEAGRSGEDA